ncbi:M12 family metallopeptidase [Dyadobacter sp. CY107]|uniref:M12 family metallopeptidase n=1 Tax=Dyadobacter fanqingshengii TaxID=2906443 RepID=UPI001F2E3162|nr:M12 family metallopeptidase [Dyadobacter fanqingshengii]MCF2502078.1 M12 family metallopeptidase [Dyadobacter fanqingshengii]
MASSILSSCEDKLGETTPGKQTANVRSDSTGVLKKGTFRGIPVTYEEINGKAILEGDILLTKADLMPVDTTNEGNNARIKGAGLANKNQRWQDWTIPYEIGSNLDNSRISKAIQHWEAKTPLRFVPRKDQTDYIHFVKSNDGNYSPVGRQGGRQEIQLKEDNQVAVIIHEIGHAVGLYHEHSRRDRDNYINILWDNIWPNRREYFNRWPIGQGFDYGSFDYQSVMMYPTNAFSQNGQLTITRKDGQTWTQGTELSSNDVSTVIALYSNLYIVKAGSLYVVNPKDGRSAFLGKDWHGAAKTFAENDQYIWGIQGGKLWKANRYNGAYEPVGADDWTGAQGLTGQDAQGNFYAVYQKRLFKVNKYGQRTQLGSREWPVVKTLYYHNNALYVAWGVLLNKVNITTGEIEATYGKLQWSGTQAIAAVTGDAKYLYVMRNNALFRVNLDTGAVEGGEYFANAKAMTGVAGYLYIVSGSDLIKMDEYSNKQTLSGGWSQTESIGVVRNPKLLSNN